MSSSTVRKGRRRVALARDPRDHGAVRARRERRDRAGGPVDAIDSAWLAVQDAAAPESVQNNLVEGAIARRLTDDGFPTRMVFSNYFVARSGVDGDHRMYMVDVDPRTGSLSYDDSWRDEVTGRLGFDFNRTNWPGNGGRRERPVIGARERHDDPQRTKGQSQCAS